MLTLTLAAFLASPSLVAQDRDARALLRPVTSNVQARTLRLDPATGELECVTGPIESSGLQTVYDNTCPTGYFVGLNTQAQNGVGSEGPLAIGDWGGLPATGFAGSSSCTTGCADEYQIAAFTFEYCTTDGVPVDMVLHFWNVDANGGTGLNACDGVQLVGGAVPPVLPRAAYPPSATGMADLTLTGLPRSAGVLTGTDRACYAIEVLLDAPGFALDGGVDGLTNLSTMGDRFSWSMQVTNGNGGTGPMLAGNALAGTPCTMCAGTLWQAGGETDDPGIGLGQSNIIWLDTYGGSTPATGNCYFFGGNPWAGMSLVLEATTTCDDPTGFCDVDDGALAACPCDNPGKPDTGCDNAQATGGVKLSTVAQSLAPNGATLTGTGFPTAGSPTAVVLRSTSLEPAPAAFGDGVRCIAVTPLVRMGADLAQDGVSTHAFGHGAGAGTFHYQLWYRNLPSGFCDPAAGFNLSSGRSLAWP